MITWSKMSMPIRRMNLILFWFLSSWKALADATRRRHLAGQLYTPLVRGRIASVVEVAFNRPPRNSSSRSTTDVQRNRGGRGRRNTRGNIRGGVSRRGGGGRGNASHPQQTDSVVEGGRGRRQAGNSVTTAN